MVTITARQMTGMAAMLEHDRLVALECELAGQFPDLARPVPAAVARAAEFGFEQFQDIRSLAYLYAENHWDFELPPPYAWIRDAFQDVRMPASERLRWVRLSLEARKATETSNEIARAGFLASRRGSRLVKGDGGDGE